MLHAYTQILTAADRHSAARHREKAFRLGLAVASRNVGQTHGVALL